MKIAEFMADGSPRVGLRVKVRSKGGDDVIGEFRRFRADGRKVLLVLKIGRKLVEVRPQDAVEVAA
jgi:hypothetical protein